jgi:hypothetical protein
LESNNKLLVRINWGNKLKESPEITREKNWKCNISKSKEFQDETKIASSNIYGDFKQIDSNKIRDKINSNYKISNFKIEEKKKKEIKNIFELLI